MKIYRHFQRFLSGSVTAGVLVAGLTIPVTDALAQSAYCSNLRAQIESLPRVSRVSNKGEARRIGRLVKRQKSYLNRAARDLRRNQCLTSRGRLVRGASGKCRAIMSKYGEMQRNLQSLERQQQRASGASLNSAVTKRRAKLEKQYRRSGCSANVASLQPQRKKGFLERLFGSRRNNNYRDGFDGLREETGGGVYRTVCARMCDGYYFPISFATYSSQFGSDEALCRARSGGRDDVRLFAYKNPSQTPEDMVDINGARYVDTPNAFKYRTSFDASCQRPQGALTTIAGGLRAGGLVENGKLSIDNPEIQAALAPVGENAAKPRTPISRPDFSQDYESQLLIAGDFVLKPVSERDQTQELLAKYDPKKIENGTIRLVGPKFLPGQGSAKLLQVPGREASLSTPDGGA